MEFPRFISLKSKYNHKYLHFKLEEVETHGFLQFSGTELLTPYTKFEVMPAKSKLGLFHIRCCYNNKYWVRWSPSHSWIVAQAVDPEEDQSKWSCTLFEPVYVDKDANLMSFRHVQCKCYACLWRVEEPYDSCLYAGYTTHDRDQCNMYTVFDWKSLYVMPKLVTFKSDNRKYICIDSDRGSQLVRFISDDIDDPKVVNQVIINNDGSVSIKSNYNGKFWRTTSSGKVPWVCADSDESNRGSFWPVKVSSNVIALRHTHSNQFIKRYTDEDVTSGVIAQNPSITTEASLVLEEPVTSRHIYNIDYHIRDARIYNKSAIIVCSRHATNLSRQPRDEELKFLYIESKSSTWNSIVSNSIVSFKSGIKKTSELSIPRMEKGNIEKIDEYSGELEWGKTQTSLKQVENVHHVVVPPMSKVKVSLLATKVAYDIPFSYNQSDTLLSGEKVTCKMDDGIYTGINCFDFKLDTERAMINVVTQKWCVWGASTQNLTTFQAFTNVTKD